MKKLTKKLSFKILAQKTNHSFCRRKTFVLHHEVLSRHLKNFLIEALSNEKADKV